MSRLPIRARLTLGFGVAMAAILLATSALVYVRTGRALEEGVVERLELLAAGDVSGAPPADEGVFQLLDPDGTVVRAGNSSSQAPLLAPDEVRGVAAGQRLESIEQVAGVDGRVRLLAVPSGEGALVVGLSLEERDEALDDLLLELVLIEPIALLLAALLGFGIATAALRPVEAMRREAEAVSAVEPGRRLPLPPADDEIRRLCETLNSMLDRLEAALVRERAFVADASHELRTPLTLLQTELELALRRPRTAEELERALRSAAEETDRLALLADDLLVLAGHDEGAIPLQRTPLAIGALLERISRRFESRARLAGRVLEVLPPDEELVVVGDGLRLEQALGNLVANAFVHGAGAIRLSAEAAGADVVLHVRDEGPGLTPEFLPHAFERFGRADAGRTAAGAGLGLAIVRVLGEAHGGSAELENLPGGGLDARLLLPRARA